MSTTARRRPFEGEPRAVVVLPEADPTFGGNAALLELEKAELEAELGTAVELSTSDPGEGARWLLVLDAERAGPATVEYEPEAKLIVSRAVDVGGLLESMNLWRIVARSGGGSASATDCEGLEQAIERVTVEVADTYPAFGLRGLDWDAICARHVERVRATDDPLAALQSWLAELQDGHTWVWPAFGNLPYALRLDDEAATFVRVRAGSAGEEVGVGRGWALAEIDGAPVDVPGWLDRTAAPPHSRPVLAGRRLLAGPVGQPRTLTAVSPAGELVVWEDAPIGRPGDPLVHWRRVGPGVGYLRIEAWIADAGIDESIDAAIDELRSCESLVVDLRGNPGGNLVLACRTRDRFLRERTVLGSIRYSIGERQLAEPFPLVGEPSPAEQRWPGRVVVLTDELTFSSSEDFLLGLQGLEHVRVVGRPSGGGSGRPRSLRLLPGWTLTASTALTYDREGSCVEGAGIPVDVEISGTDDEVLAAALAVL